jgi:RhtB (resistance to homoserine/threonine) family protein
MLGIVNYGTFVAAILLFLAIPGPGLLGIIAATGKSGKRAGFASTLGVMMGDWVHMGLAGLGVAALLQANPLVFKGIQYLGAAYLIYLGIGMLRAQPSQAGDAAAGEAMAAGGRHFRRLFLVTLANPKAIVFYMAFFPLFIDPAQHHGIWTLLAMVTTVSSITVLFCFSVVLLANLLATRFKRSARMSKVLHRLAGISLIGFGIKLTAS